MSIWLGWQALREVGAQRLPPGLALRISPSSSVVLQRAAEAELAAKNLESAKELAALSLSKAPFNVRALRVLGLAKAETGEPQIANELLTLAGNWSLRDDPTHAWLVQQRLSNGNYGSAFAHADTLVRRRPDLEAQIFNLFATATLQDTRAIPAIVDLLENNPPWRYAFLTRLSRSVDEQPAAASLAVALETTQGRFTDVELGTLYYNLRAGNRIPAMRVIRANLRRPDPEALLMNGDFEGEAAPAPFGWSMDPAPGIAAEILQDDHREDENALRVQYNGYTPASVAEQFLLLEPGIHTFAGRYRVEAGDARGRMTWRISCLESGAVIAETGLADAATPGSLSWTSFRVAFSVPTVNCTAQSLRLTPTPAERRSTIVVWYDNLSLGRGAAALGVDEAPAGNQP